MRFAFAIVSMFPGGGLQRDCVEIARALQERGHAVTIFTSRQFGANFTDDLLLKVLDVDERTNHSRQDAFGRKFLESAGGWFDLLVGFDKLPGLDVLYCSDRSIRARVSRNPFLSILPRYRQYIALESECFASGGDTSILLLSEEQRREYSGSWACDERRLAVLPPTLLASRQKPELRHNGARESLRAKLGISSHDWAWLSVCAQPKTKGLDRTVKALARYSDACLLVCGLNSGDRKAEPVLEMAQRLGVSKRIRWLGHREDIPEVMAAADLFVHPARHETTGTALLEAVVNGLPVVASARCGYADHVTRANAGILLEEPYSDRIFVEALDAARDGNNRLRWSAGGAKYGRKKHLYDGRRRAVDLIVAKAIDRIENNLRTNRLFWPEDTASSQEISVCLPKRLNAIDDTPSSIV
jgi:UDP-glucose:(heptosyl)LPS alpha-1,3-glucosyltransferase